MHTRVVAKRGAYEGELVDTACFKDSRCNMVARGRYSASRLVDCTLAAYALRNTISLKVGAPVVSKNSMRFFFFFFF